MAGNTGTIINPKQRPYRTTKKAWQEADKFNQLRKSNLASQRVQWEVHGVDVSAIPPFPVALGQVSFTVKQVE